MSVLWNCIGAYRSSLIKFIVLYLLLLFLLPSSHAGQATLAWTSNSEPHLGGYTIYYGEISGSYTDSVDVGVTTSHVVASLKEGTTYYFNIKAYDISGMVESVFAGEVSFTVPIIAPPPIADFAAGTTSGIAPLTVLFQDNSTGSIADWAWDLGNGNTSSAPQAITTYTDPGTYTVSLSVTGAGGSHTETKIDYITVLPEVPGDGPGDGPSDGPGDVTGPVAAYGFDEGAGAMLLDSTANGNDGVIDGANWVTGRFGTALSSDGKDDWVTVADASSLDLTTGMTLEAWVYPTIPPEGWRTIILKEQPDSTLYYLSANSEASRPASGIFSGGERILYGESQLPPDAWSHLAATFDGENQRLYLNGTLIAERYQTGNVLTSDNPLRIGGNAIWGEYFQGYIDEVRIYDRALAEQEIQSDMEISVADSDSGDSDGTGSKLLEHGEIMVDDNWQRITFSQSFDDPVVIAAPLSYDHSEPAVVRIRNVDQAGFEIRVQSWDYLGGLVVPETVGYLVVERGHHVLSDGTRLEADYLETSQTRDFQSIAFHEGFATTPVVVTATSSFNEADAVTTRIKNVSPSGFALRLQEQEANARAHASEIVSYIAWEITSGELNGVQFEIGRTTDTVKHQFYPVQFQQMFSTSPVFIAAMQTTDGVDTANLRWKNKTPDNIELKVTEEQSKDNETNHTSEVVGYMLFSNPN